MSASPVRSDFGASGPDHAPFDPKDPRGVDPYPHSLGVLKERGQLRSPRIGPEHEPALRAIFGMEDRVSLCPIPGHAFGTAHIAEGGRHRFEGDELIEDQVLWCNCLGRRVVIVRDRETGREYERDLGPAMHWYSLSDVYFAVKTGTELGVGFRTRFRDAYALMLKAELGLLQGPRVELREVPELSDRASKAADLFARLYSAQIGAGFPDPGCMSVRLVQEWCQCRYEDAWQAISELVAAGVIERAGKLGRRQLFRPGRCEED